MKFFIKLILLLFIFISSVEAENLNVNQKYKDIFIENNESKYTNFKYYSRFPINIDIDKIRRIFNYLQKNKDFYLNY